MKTQPHTNLSADETITGDSAQDETFFQQRAALRRSNSGIQLGRPHRMGQSGHRGFSLTVGAQIRDAVPQTNKPPTPP